MKPIDVTEKNSVHIQSVVTKVDKEGMGDYIVELEDKSGMYFISRANAQNLNIKRLAKAVDGRRAYCRRLLMMYVRQDDIKITVKRNQK